MPTETIAATDLAQLAHDVLGRAKKAGATDAEVVVYEGDEFSTHVRLGQVETLKQSGSRAIGLRVYIASGTGANEAQRTASTSSSDLSSESLARLVSGAVQLARITTPDPFAGLPEQGEFGQHDPAAQHLYFEDVVTQDPAQRIETARAVEAAAMAYDARIRNSAGGDYDASTFHKVLVNSRGFTGEYRRTYCGFSAQPIAQEADGKMQRNYWYSSSRTTRLLEDPVAIGQEAARRALRRLGARRVPTQQAPVVFSPEIARSIIGNLFDAANADAVYRHATFLADKLGEQVAGPNITVIDDGTLVFNHSIDRRHPEPGAPRLDSETWEEAATNLDSRHPERSAERGVEGPPHLSSGPAATPCPIHPAASSRDEWDRATESADIIPVGGFGTSPFDGEGLPTRRTVLVENGVLKNYVANTYTARKLGIRSTGNASRSLASNPGIGAGNFYLEPGTLTPAQIIGDVKSGLYVTETMGFGVNLVTGDYSQGAAGLWIENGELAYPVEEITIAGNLKDMYRNITAIGSDLTFRSSAATPTLRIDGMTIAGS